MRPLDALVLASSTCLGTFLLLGHLLAWFSLLMIEVLPLVGALSVLVAGLLYCKIVDKENR